MFVTEDGTISGWNPGVNLHNAVLVVDNSDEGSPNGAVYKSATTALHDGKHSLYVTNFRSGKVEVYDTTFKRVHSFGGAFDPDGDGDHDFDDRGAEQRLHPQIYRLGEKSR